MVKPREPPQMSRWLLVISEENEMAIKSQPFKVHVINCSHLRS